MKKVNEVFKTKNYSIFKNLLGNRVIDKTNLARLKNSMNDIGTIDIPIIVNENYEVIDGQHRLQACKDLNREVCYMVIKGCSLKEVHKLNTIGKKWGFYDYLEAYANAGLQDYQIAKRFVDKYKFGYVETLAMLGGCDRIDFIDGKLKIKDYQDAIQKAESIKMIAPYYSGFKRRSFVMAMLKCFDIEGFSIATFTQKLSIQRTKMVDCATLNQYLMLIEDIYNYKSRGEKVRFI